MRESSLGDVGGGVRGSKKQAERGEYVQKMTVSAAVKLIPNPPALVERQKTKISGLFISFILHSISLTSLAGRKEMEEERSCRLLRSLLRSLGTHFVCQAVTISLL